jgi:hypothetical protein
MSRFTRLGRRPLQERPIGVTGPPAPKASRRSGPFPVAASVDQKPRCTSGSRPGSSMNWSGWVGCPVPSGSMAGRYGTFVSWIWPLTTFRAKMALRTHHGTTCRHDLRSLGVCARISGSPWQDPQVFPSPGVQKGDAARSARVVRVHGSLQRSVGREQSRRGRQSMAAAPCPILWFASIGRLNSRT